jgi:hypothetical protein
VNVAALGTPDTVYVGEQATYEVAVFIDEELLRQRAARNPTFTPPDLRGTLAYELPTNTGLIASRSVGGKLFKPHVYQRAIFPLVPGTHVVPAVSLDYSLPAAGSFYGREETHTLRADSVVIVARALPDAGRPQDFAGAVGEFAIERALSAFILTVGDPVTVRARVSGFGNIRLLPRPDLLIPWADVLAADEKVETTVVDGRISGVKEFSWVVTPREPGIQRFPAMRYPFFHPGSRRYETAAAGGTDVEVRGSTPVPNNDAVDSVRAALPVRVAFRDGGSRSREGALLLAVLALMAPLPAALTIFARRRRERHPQDSQPTAGAGRWPDVPHSPADARQISALPAARHQFLTSVERRLQLAHGLTADARAFRKALLRAGVSRDTAERAQQVVSELDESVFGAGSNVDPALQKSALDCFARIDAEAIR